jgi:rare lipoprotein A
MSAPVANRASKTESRSALPFNALLQHYRHKADMTMPFSDIRFRRSKRTSFAQCEFFAFCSGVAKTALVSLLISFFCIELSSARDKNKRSGTREMLSGIASIYDRSSGEQTASGEPLQEHAFTAAHRTLPFNTVVEVTNHRTGRKTLVRINDRGPFVRGRIIDLTPAAAKALGFSGITHVSLATVSATEAP